jgi:hypothetical protein
MAHQNQPNLVITVPCAHVLAPSTRLPHLSNSRRVTLQERSSYETNVRSVSSSSRHRTFTMEPAGMVTSMVPPLGRYTKPASPHLSLKDLSGTQRPLFYLEGRGRPALADPARLSNRGVLSIAHRSRAPRKITRPFAYFSPLEKKPGQRTSSFACWYRRRLSPSRVSHDPDKEQPDQRCSLRPRTSPYLRRPSRS